MEHTRKRIKGYEGIKWKPRSCPRLESQRISCVTSNGPLTNSRRCSIVESCTNSCANLPPTITASEFFKKTLVVLSCYWWWLRESGCKRIIVRFIVSFDDSQSDRLMTAKRSSTSTIVISVMRIIESTDARITIKKTRPKAGATTHVP